MDPMRTQTDTLRTAVLVASLLAFGLFVQFEAAGANLVPDLIAYQGQVYVDDGSTDINGTYDIEFYLYNVPTLVEGPVVWGEKHTAVPVARGLFSVLLGAGAAIEGETPAVAHGSLAEVFQNDEVYIQLKVGSGEGFRSIRRRFVATPHALRVQNAVKAVHGVPPGTIMPFAGSTAPYGWLLCDGGSHARSTYPDLFEALGTTWGSGSVPPDTFSVPNLGDRIPVGVVTGDSAQELGDYAGTATHTLSGSETPRHKHHYMDNSYNGAIYVGGPWLWGEHDMADDVEQFDTRDTGNTGGGQSHSNVQPSVLVKYIIKW